MASRTATELVEVIREFHEQLPEDMVEVVASGPGTKLAGYLHADFEAEMIGPFGFTESRPGVEGLIEGWRDFLEPFKEFRVRPNEVVAVDGGALVLVDQSGRMRDSDAEVTTSSALLWRFRDGLIARAEFFLDADEARRAANISAE